jgi:hypothetical protein
METPKNAFPLVKPANDNRPKPPDPPHPFGSRDRTHRPADPAARPDAAQQRGVETEAALPVADARPPEEIIGYDETGLPPGQTMKRCR